VILACHDCSRQLCFSGRDRRGVAASYGWSENRNKFYCAGCAHQLDNHESAAVSIEHYGHFRAAGESELAPLHAGQSRGVGSTAETYRGQFSRMVARGWNP
jgi:hypothetical protein